MGWRPPVNRRRLATFAVVFSARTPRSDTGTAPAAPPRVERVSLAPLAVAWLAGLVAGAFLPPGPWRAGVALAAGSAGLFATAWGGTAESPRKL
ncbi:MAG: hypothetical protein ACOC9O_02755, partial [Myxococcota bacterium]